METSAPKATVPPARGNVILVCLAVRVDAHAAGFAKTPPEESTRDGFVAEDRDGSSGNGLGSAKRLGARLGRRLRLADDIRITDFLARQATREAA